jgi:hypothetical protein
MGNSRSSALCTKTRNQEAAQKETTRHDMNQAAARIAKQATEKS